MSGKRWTNERADASLANLPGQRVGDVYQKPVGTQGRTRAAVLIDWQGCDCEPQLVCCDSLSSGNTKGCAGCLHQPGDARDVAQRAAVRAAKLRQAEATLDRANRMKKHRGYEAWLLDTRLVDRKGRTARWIGYRCPSGHEGEMTLGNWARGKGCPSCADRGIDYNAVGYLYVVAGKGWIKVGICNKTGFKRRLTEHRRQGLIELLHAVRFERTADAKALEDLWKEQRKKIPVELLPGKEDILDGYTEAAPDIAMIRRWLKGVLVPLGRAA